MLYLLKDYLEKKIDLMKLDVTEKSALVSGIIYYFIIFIIFIIFFVMFFSLGIGLLIGHYLNNYAYGLLIMSGICLLSIFIVIKFKKNIQKQAANLIIKLLSK